MSTQQKYNKTQKLLEEYYALKELKNKIYFREGRILFELFKDSLYKEAFGGDKYEAIEPSWKRFTTEITEMPVSTADQKRKIYGRWISELGYTEDDLSGITYTKLYYAIPYANDRKTADEIVKFALENPCDIESFNHFLKTNYEKTQ
jgi:hypothetical protein